MPVATETDAIRVGIRAGFPSTVESVEYVNEGSNDVYIIETTDEKYVVKFNTFSYSDMFRTEVVVTEFLNEALDSPSIPAVYDHDATRSNADVPYYVMEYLPGVPPASLSETYSSSLVKTMGSAIAKLGNAPGDEIDASAYGLIHRDPGTDAMYAETETWREYYLNFVEGVLEHGKDVGHMELVAEFHDDVLAALHSLEDSIPTHPPKGIVLDDFRLGNVLVSQDDSSQITGVLDVERATLGDGRLTLINTEHLLGRDLDADTRRRLRDDLERGFGQSISLNLRKAYRLGSLARELRAFNFWYRDESQTVRNRHTSRLKEALHDFCDDN